MRFSTSNLRFLFTCKEKGPIRVRSSRFLLCCKCICTSFRSKPFGVLRCTSFCFYIRTRNYSPNIPGECCNDSALRCIDIWNILYLLTTDVQKILILVTRFAFYATIFLVQRRLCFFSLFGRIYYRIKWSDSYGQNYMECLTYSNKENIGDIKGELTCTWRAPRLIRDNIRSSYSHPFLRRSFWHLFEPACIIYCGDKTRCIFLRERNLDKRCSLVVVLISPRYVSVHISPLSSDNSVACVFLRILLTNFCRICS